MTCKSPSRSVLVAAPTVGLLNKLENQAGNLVSGLDFQPSSTTRGGNRVGLSLA